MPRKPAGQPDTEVLERIDPDEEAANGAVDGDIGYEFELDPETLDKGRRYIGAHDDDQDIRYWKSLGYVEERHVEDGIRLRGRPELKEGEVIKVRDHVIMSCPLAQHERRLRGEKARTAPLHKRLEKTRTSDVRLQSSR